MNLRYVEKIGSGYRAYCCGAHYNVSKTQDNAWAALLDAEKTPTMAPEIGDGYPPVVRGRTLTEINRRLWLLECCIARRQSALMPR